MFQRKVSHTHICNDLTDVLLVYVSLALTLLFSLTARKGQIHDALLNHFCKTVTQNNAGHHPMVFNAREPIHILECFLMFYQISKFYLVVNVHFNIIVC